MAHGKIKTENLPRFISHFIVPFIVGAVVGLGLCSCSPCERLARRCPPIEYVRDSIVVYDTFTRETTITDTLLYVRLIPEYVYVQTPVTDTASGETSYATGKAWVDGTRVMLVMRNKDSAEVLAQRIKTLERNLSYWKKVKQHTIVKTEYRTRGIVEVGAWIGLAAVIFLLIRIAVFIARRR